MSEPIVDRRAFLQGCSLAAAGLVKPQSVCAATPGAKLDFTHRVYNGWIRDFATEPRPNAAWPCLDIDDQLIADYHAKFQLMHSLGFNKIVIWGIYVANDWPLDITSCIDDRRALRIEQVLTSAHGNGVKVLCGLGTYSWGFGAITRAYPGLSRGNPNAICASNPESHKWMRRIVDFVMHRFPIDGVSMQSADQGRCKCSECAHWSDVEYHANLNIQMADYIHAKWPGKTIGMSNWGVSFGDPKDLPALVKLSRSLDYMIDYNDSARWGGPQYRRELLDALACPAGTSGGLVVEPPLHWARDRWFLPTCRNVHDHIQKLASDGGRAVEFFYHILANPSSEVTFHVAGRTLSQPDIVIEKALGDAVDELYRPTTTTTRDALVQFFLDAEHAYLRHQPTGSCGDISLEPLVGDKPGLAIYLRDRLTPDQRRAYARDLQRLSDVFDKLRAGLPSSPRLVFTARAGRVVACLNQVRKELAAII